MNQAQDKKTYVERTTEIINEMRPYRSADGSLKLEKKTADLLEQYLLGISALADKRKDKIDRIMEYIKTGTNSPR